MTILSVNQCFLLSYLNTLDHLVSRESPRLSQQGSPLRADFCYSVQAQHSGVDLPSLIFTCLPKEPHPTLLHPMFLLRAQGMQDHLWPCHWVLGLSFGAQQQLLVPNSAATFLPIPSSCMARLAAEKVLCKRRAKGPGEHREDGLPFQWGSLTAERGCTGEVLYGS